MEESKWTPEETQQWMCDQLKDINGDTDCILSMLHKDKEESKMGDHFDMGMLTGMLQNRGIDPGIVAMLNDKKDGWGQDSIGFLILILLFVGGFGNGLGGFGGNNATIAGVDTNAVLNAINTQGVRQEAAIGNIANTLGCSFGQVQAALASVDKQLAVNQGSIVNAIQSCCCNLGNKIDSVGCGLQSSIDKCCCQTNLNIERSANSLANQLNLQSQLIQKSFCDQNAYLADQFCQIKLREQENTIAELRNRVLEQSQDAQTRILLDAIGGGPCPFGMVPAKK